MLAQVLALVLPACRSQHSSCQTQRLAILASKMQKLWCVTAFCCGEVNTPYYNVIIMPPSRNLLMNCSSSANDLPCVAFT